MRRARNRITRAAASAGARAVAAVVNARNPAGKSAGLDKAAPVSILLIGVPRRDVVEFVRTASLWPSQRKPGVGGRDEIFVVARSCDRSHGGRVEKAAVDETIVNVDTDDLPEGD